MRIHTTTLSGVIFLALACLIGGALGSSLPLQGVTIHTNGTLSITADPSEYSPSMSSTVGIGLTPLYEGSTSQVVYRWKTTRGTFLSWSPPDYKVITLGKKTVNSGGKVYWAWRGKIPQGPIKEPLAVINLVATDAASGKRLGGKTGYITYSDNLFHFSLQ
ncbi:MAG: hypothetical protein NT074_02260 [Methanomicrobiales archaeon]|nr:hypothetical protein [Methanomicrobiales archaeon]